MTYEEVREMVHAAVRREEWYNRFISLLKDDEYFLKDILAGANEEEIERCFTEFTEYEQYRSVIG